MSAPADPHSETQPDLATELLTALTAAVRRLGRITTECADHKVALRAAEAIVKLAGQHQRAQAREKAEPTKAEAPRPRAEVRTPRDEAPTPVPGPSPAPAPTVRPTTTNSAPPFDSTHGRRS